QCIELATAILARWPTSRDTWDEPSPAMPGDLLRELAALEDPGLIGAFLGGVLVKDAAVEPGESLPTLCERHGWGTFRDELLAVVKRTTRETMERNVGLLEQLSTARPRKKQGWRELCSTLAPELVSSIESIDRKRSSAGWGAREVDRAKVLAG